MLMAPLAVAQGAVVETQRLMALLVRAVTAFQVAVVVVLMFQVQELLLLVMVVMV
jgi:hypothetical protein